MAIEHGLSILQWYENLPKDEVPPEHMWEDVEGLDMWWKDVEAKREDGVATTRGRGTSRDEDAGDGNRDNEMVENDFARYFK